jgi:hypothetical protein
MLVGDAVVDSDAGRAAIRADSSARGAFVFCS